MLALLAMAVLTAPEPAFAGGRSAPAFRLPSARENRWIGNEDFAGQVLFMDIARTNCPRSAAAAPDLVGLRKLYKSKGFEVLTVYDELAGTPDDPFARVLTDAARKGFAHPIAVNDGSEFHEGYYRQVQSTPSAFLISRSGKVEFLGAGPLDEGRIAATRERIEALLEEAPGDKLLTEERPPLKPFSLLLYSGGVVRSSELTGRPTVIVAWAPGAPMDRLASALERLQRKVANRARIFAVTFSDFDQGLTAATACPGVTMAAPDSRTHTALGASQLPQVIFVDSRGRVAKRMTTLYGAYGIEGAVMERLTRCLLAEDGIDIEDGTNGMLVYDAKNQVSFMLSPAFRMASGIDGAKMEFVGMPGVDPKKPPKVRSKIVSSEVGDDAISKAKVAAASSCKNYKVDSEERLRNGGVMLSEQWEDGGRSIRGLRLFVNTPKGLLEIDASGLVGDLNNHWDQLRSTAQSVVVGR